MSYKAGKRTMANLCGVHPELVAAVLMAFRYAKQDFCIVDGGGLRTQAQADSNAARGVGIKRSQHLPQADGFGHAVDLVAYQAGRPSWEKGLYRAIHHAMFQACDELGIAIQNGADWDNDGITGERGEWDWPHFQLPKWPHTLAAAKAAAERRKEQRRLGMLEVLS
jgi:peptidoglycan L-alanyl-D-glutamate endopeptidase CwlK